MKQLLICLDVIGKISAFGIKKAQGIAQEIRFVIRKRKLRHQVKEFALWMGIDVDDIDLNLLALS